MKMFVMCALAILGLSTDASAAGCDGAGVFGIRGRAQQRQAERQVGRSGGTVVTTRSIAASSYTVVGNSCATGNCPLPQKAQPMLVLPVDPMKKK